MNCPALALSLSLLLAPLAGASAPAAETENPALGASTVVRFSGREAISTPFEIEADLATTNPSLKFGPVVGQPLALTLMPGWSVHGIIGSIELAGVSAEKAVYRVRLVPAVSKLGYALKSRSFNDKTAVEIVQALLHEHAPVLAEYRIGRALVRREITVQQQETDLAFLSRLMADEGIHYHFEHAPSGHKIVFSDTNGGFPALARLTFPAAAPPGVQVFTRGEAMAGAQRCSGEANHPRLHAGHRFLLAGHFRADFNQEYILTHADYGVTPKGLLVAFQCTPFAIVYRPEAASRPP